MDLDHLVHLQGDQIAAAAHIYEGDERTSRLVVFDLQTREVLRQWNYGEGFIKQLEPAGRQRFASISTDSTVRLWDADEGRLLAVFSFDVEPSALAVSPSGETLLVGDYNGVIHFLDLVGLGSEPEISDLTIED